MDVSKMLLAGIAVVGLAVSTAEAQSGGASAAQSSRAAGSSKPWREVRGLGRVLDLTQLPMVVDQPGLYAIDRNWQIPETATSVVPELIQITADDVTLDLHGFEISADVNAPGSTLLVISGVRVEVRNGGLSACCDGAAVALRSTGGPRLHRLSVFSYETMTFGDQTSFTDSVISARAEVRFAGRSSLERNTINCNRGSRCIRLLGDGNRATDNTLTLYQGGGIEIVGDGNVVANNVVDANDAPDAFEAFDVKGDSNAVRGNTLILAGNGSIRDPFWIISGTANTIDGNIAAPPFVGAREQIGMRFTGNGNFYGNNRMAAALPFDLGGTVQTDWGGNVGY